VIFGTALAAGPQGSVRAKGRGKFHQSFFLSDDGKKDCPDTKAVDFNRLLRGNDLVYQQGSTYLSPSVLRRPRKLIYLKGTLQKKSTTFERGLPDPSFQQERNFPSRMDAAKMAYLQIPEVLGQISGVGTGDQGLAGGELALPENCAPSARVAPYACSYGAQILSCGSLREYIIPRYVRNVDLFNISC
jgi:hypothetical protein